MINLYNEQITHPDTFKQLSVRDLLFVHYKCPQAEKLIKLYNHYNLIAFSLDGERIIHQGGKSWKLTSKTSYFQRKTAYVQELPESQGWEVLGFHIPDEFLIQFAHEFMDYLSIRELPELTTEMFIKLDLNEVTRTYFYSMLPYFTQKVPVITSYSIHYTKLYDSCYLIQIKLNKHLSC